MDKIKESPSSLFLIAGIALCCILASALLLRSTGNVFNPAPSTPLSNIVLKLEDLNSAALVPTGQASKCDRYLFTSSLDNDVNQSPVECYQVKFSTHDNSIIILNAIWLYDRPGKAELEINKFSELLISTDNIGMQIINVPVSIGDKNSASSAVLTGGKIPVYATNLYWKQGSAVIRLSVISHQGPVPINMIIAPAQKIEARLRSR